MSAERSFEAWEEVQRHGLDFADSLTQGFTGLIQSHTPKLFDVDFATQNFTRDFGLATDSSGINGVSAIFDIGNRLGQAGADFGASLNGMVQHFFRSLPVPFMQDENVVPVRQGENVVTSLRAQLNASKNEVGRSKEQFRDCGYADDEMSCEGETSEEMSGFNLKAAGLFDRPQGAFNVTSTYSSRTRKVEGSLVARGDLWRVEASSGNENSSLFLLQLGPILFVRDSTLLLPVHLSKQHLLWYGYDRKNGVHSICPAVWTKHRRWLLMSMIRLNPLACSFMDLQCPNGQVTYVSGEGLSTSAFVPFCGGLLQAQGQYPGEMRFSFSCKNKLGTSITPAVQWPDNSFTLGLAQALAWKRSGLLVRPTVQFSVSPTFGGSNPGVRTELMHSVNQQLNLICGCALMENPSAFASLAVGRSRWNGNVGSSGIVLRVETPLNNVGRPSFSLQLNSGIEF